MNAVLVHIIDDDPGLRRSLEMMMEAANLPVHSYESAESFLESMDLKLPGCIVLDLRMPGMGGMELLRRLRADGHDTPAIIISGHADVPTAVLGMKLGAVDVLQKPFEPKLLLGTVQRAVESSVQSYQKRGKIDSLKQRLATLTAREMELVKLVAAGKSSKEIAEQLGITAKTVSNHRANLMAKTGALNAADLARLTVAAGVVTEE